MTAATAAHACGFCGSSDAALVESIPGERWVCTDETACVSRTRIVKPPGTAPAKHDPLRDSATDDFPCCTVSGRSEPRETPTGHPHRLTFHGVTATWDGTSVRFGPFRVTCQDEPPGTTFSRFFPQGDYTAHDLERVVTQHNGYEDEVPS